MSALWGLRASDRENVSDEEIVAEVLAGNREAFETLVRRHSSRLLRATVSILRNQTEAEDVVQDAFVSAYQHLSQFAGRAKFSTWLTRIAVHRALEVAAQGRRVSTVDVESPESKPLVSPLRTPEGNVAERECSALVRHALSRLPAHYRDVLVVRYLQEFDTAEAAEQLGISEANVKVRLHRACSMMRHQVNVLQGTHSAASATTQYSFGAA